MMFNWTHKHEIWSNSINTKTVVLPSSPRAHSAVGGISLVVEKSENVDYDPLSQKRKKGMGGTVESKNM